jgi:HK97 family phage prohead protease
MKPTARKTLPFEIKAVDDAAGTVTLYAAVFGNVDGDGEVIAPGAFVNLDVFLADGWLAHNHDWTDLPIGTIESATQDQIGLLIVSKWHSTAAAQACRTVVLERKARGKAVKCSIGYRVLESTQEMRDGKNVRILKAIELYEASIVNVPANPLAAVTGVKARKKITAKGVIDELKLARKEGRTLSKENLGRVRDWAKRCRANAALADEMEELANAFDRAQPEDDQKARRMAALKRRALAGRAGSGI